MLLHPTRSSIASWLHRVLRSGGMSMDASRYSDCVLLVLTRYKGFGVKLNVFMGHGTIAGSLHYPLLEAISKVAPKAAMLDVGANEGGIGLYMCAESQKKSRTV